LHCAESADCLTCIKHDLESGDLVSLLDRRQQATAGSCGFPKKEEGLANLCSKIWI